MGTFKEKRKLVEELKTQWKSLWRERIDDKVRAEGISDKDYSKLFVERGTVIMATRRFKAPDFFEILQQHFSSESGDISNLLPLNSAAGGWGKFVRNVLTQQHPKRRRRNAPIEPNKKASQQLKKCGRGWLHLKR